MTKKKWLVYTVLLGASPILARLFARWIITVETTAPWFLSSDLLAFGLVLAITNISGLEHASSILSGKKSVHVGMSLFLIIMMAVLYSAASFDSMLYEGLNDVKIKITASVIVVASLVYSYVIWDQLITTRE